MKYIVYRHICPNGKIYIGITKCEPQIRWNNGKGYKPNKRLYNDILKYGWINFKHEILFRNLTKEEAEQKEIELIQLYQSYKNKFGYNIEQGGKIKKGMKGIPSYARKKVICLNTKEVFDCIRYASIKYHTIVSNITKACKNQKYSAGKLEDGSKIYWAFYSDYINQKEKFNNIIIDKKVDSSLYMFINISKENKEKLNLLSKDLFMPNYKILDVALNEYLKKFEIKGK